MPEGKRSSTASPSCWRLAFTLGCRWKRERVGLRRRSLDHVFAADVVTAFGKVQAAAVNGAERLGIAVMARLQPMCAIGFLTLGLDPFRLAADAARLQFGGVGIGDGEGGVGGGGPGRVAPLGARRRELAPQFTMTRSRPTDSSTDKRAGMGEAVHAGRRRSAAVDQHYRCAQLAGVGSRLR